MLYNMIYLRFLLAVGAKARLYTTGLGEQSGVLKDSMEKVYLGNLNIDEILILLKKKMN